MNCNNCGAELPDGTEVCNYCGMVQMGHSYNMQPKPKKKLKWIILITSILVVLITAVTITIVCILNSDGHKQKSIEGTVELFFESIEEGDYEKYLSLIPPYWQEHLKTLLDSVVRNNLKKYMSDFNCGYGNKLYYKIISCEPLDKDKFLNMKRNFKNWYDVTGEIEAYVLVDIVVMDLHGNEWTFTDFDFIKIDGVWYIAFGNI